MIQESPTTPHSDEFRELGAEHRAEMRSRAALKKLQKDVNEKPSPGDATGASDTITTKSLASNGGLEEILKKVESAGSLDESLLAQDRPTYPQQNHQR